MPLRVVFIINYIFILSLFANSTPIENNTQYKNALQYYKNKKYEESFLILSYLLKDYPQSEKVNFYYARSAFEIKNYEVAFMIYDKMLINDPMNHRVRLEYARTLLMMESYDQAKVEFQKVLSSPIPEQVRKNVEIFLKQLENKTKEYFITNIAIFGFGWDNNIDNATYEYNNNLIDGLSNSNTEAKKDSSFKNILVNNITVPFESNRKLAFENTVVSYFQEQNRYHDNDIFLLSLNSGLGYIDQTKKNSFALIYDNIWIGGDKSIYLYGISDTFKLSLDQKQLLSLGVKYKKKKYINQEEQNKNSTIKEFDLEYALFLENKGKLTLGGNIETERKEKGTRTDVSKDNFTYKIGYEKSFLDSYSYNISYQFSDSRYKIASIFGGTLPKRKDKEHTVSLKITKQLDKKQSIYMDIARIDNRSNNNIYSYKKTKLNLNYMVLF